MYCRFCNKTQLEIIGYTNCKNCNIIIGFIGDNKYTIFIVADESKVSFDNDNLYRCIINDMDNKIYFYNWDDVYYEWFNIKVNNKVNNEVNLNFIIDKLKRYLILK